MTLHLTKVYRSSTDKAGNPLKTKAGKPYTRLSIKAEEFGDKWISGFASSWNEMWTEGDAVDAEVKQSGEYLNVEKLDVAKIQDERIARLEAKVSKLESVAFGGFVGTPAPKEEEVNLSDIPF